jgi:hypothetical protein
MDTWIHAYMHTAKLTTVHHKCARWPLNAARWDCKFKNITMSVHKLKMPNEPMGQVSQSK